VCVCVCVCVGNILIELTDCVIVEITASTNDGVVRASDGERQVHESVGGEGFWNLGPCA